MKFSIVIIIIIAINFTCLLLNHLLKPQNPESKLPMHIGCYLGNHNLNKYNQLKHRMNKLVLSEQTAYGLNQLNSLNFNETSFEKKSLALAKTFEKYIQLAQTKRISQIQDRDIITALRQAEQQYLSCKRRINYQYQSQKCEENWAQYEDCFKDFDEIKSNLLNISKAQNQIKQKIESFIKKPDNPINSNRLQEDIYNQKIQENTQERKQLLVRQQILHKNNKSKTYLVSKAIEQLKDQIKPYNQCVENRKQFRNCEQITKSINTLDFGSIQILKERAIYKQEMLTKLLVVLGKPEDQGSMQLLNQQYKKHRQELKRMLKTYIEGATQIKKACGCSEQYENILKNQVEELQKNINSYNKQLQNIQSSVLEIDKLLIQNEAERQQVMRNYKNSKTNHPNSLPFDSKILIFNKQLENQNQKALLFQDKYHEINRKCEQIKKRMAQRIKDIDLIGQCLSKKDYYIKLNEKSVIYLYANNKKASGNSIEELTALVKSFDSQL